MIFNSPLSEKRAMYLIEQFKLKPQQVVADFGCGKGTFLHQLASHVPIIGYGIDKDEGLIEEAKSNWQADSTVGTLEFISDDCKTYVENMKPVDAIICIGSEYIFGGYKSLLETMKPLLKPKGKALIGTIYWKQAPPKDYLALMNNENPYHDLHTTVDMAYKAGYLPLDIGRSNNDEWDRFESHTAQQYYSNNTQKDSYWQWQSGYLKWGIHTMGFCFLLLENMEQ